MSKSLPAIPLAALGRALAITATTTTALLLIALASFQP